MSRVRVDVVSIFPEYLAPLELSLIGKARRDGAAESGPRGVDLGLRIVGLDLEGEVEPSGAGELAEQVVEHGDSGRDVDRSRALGDPRAAHSSTRSIIAPSAWRRSSIRS